MTQAHLVGISGSLRAASYNTALLRAAFENLPDGVTASIASLKDIPLFDQDEVSAHGKPASVSDLRSAVAAADGIVFATPEYNWSVTGAMKNAIDWLSGGPDSPLDFKPAAIIGIGGGSGTARSQEHLRDILGHNSLCILADPQVMVSGLGRRFDGLELADADVGSELEKMIDGLLGLVERSRSRERIDVQGSVLIVGAVEDHAATAVRSLVEMGYRTLQAASTIDAERILTKRAVAAIVLDPAIEAVDRTRVGTAAGDLPIVMAIDPATVGGLIDDTLRYGTGPE
ncbi:MAG: NAD(P)H-dependent oxidoreductase [Actinomycetota bacterium]|nr:NAD(P)H-dependent oxidoreductase [Actinomycetota bacterium]